MIIDEVAITVEGGSGGDGCLSFRREKYIPRGGPDGGNGGRGGDIFLEARTDVHTLVDFVYRPLYRANHGVHGKGKNMHGRAEPSVTVRVPVGTLVKNDKNELIVDMNEDAMRVLIAKGGRGGRGNSTFTTSTLQAPKLAERGEPGEIKILHLELKMLADVGVVGFPNAGKSTLLSRVTQARPKIADYPFTTLEPQLGVVRLSEGRSFVMADVPGIIEGASGGKGLGIKFLKHLERTRVLLHLVELATLTKFTELEKKVKVIQKELKLHNLKFQKLPQILVLSKLDAAAELPVEEWMEKLRKKGHEVLTVSSVSGEGLKTLLERTWKILVDSIPDTSTAAPVAAKTLYLAKGRFKVEEKDGVFRVTGNEVKKWVAMTNFENPAAVERFHKILGRMGVLKELKKMGVQEGNAVICDNQELFFESEHLGAYHEK